MFLLQKKPYSFLINSVKQTGHPQGFKPRIARITQIILGQHDETDDTDFASGCALNNPVVELRLRSLRNCK